MSAKLLEKMSPRGKGSQTNCLASALYYAGYADYALTTKVKKDQGTTKSGLLAFKEHAFRG
jgi:hypothetical protein